MTELVPKKKTLSSSMIPDWSLLPEELLHIVSTHVDDCFDVVHALSVCSTWRSTFPFPSSLLRPSYSLPPFSDEFYGVVEKDLYTLEKVPLFLFRAKTPPGVSTCDYFLGGIGQDKFEDQLELSSPVQCSVKLNTSTDPILMNMHDCQIIPLGHQYRMTGWCLEPWSTRFRGVVFLPLNEKKGEFIVLLYYFSVLLVLRSAEMRWMRLKENSIVNCSEVIAFRGRFYATFLNGYIFVYDPYSLKGTPLMPSQPLSGSWYLVRTGNDDELFLVEYYNPNPEAEVIDFNRFACRVSKLDEEASTWVEVSDLGERVFFIGQYGNVSCSAKELPSGSGLSGNSIVFTCEPGIVNHVYKYGVGTGQEEDEPNCWRALNEKCVRFLSKSPVVALRVEL